MNRPSSSGQLWMNFAVKQIPDDIKRRAEGETSWSHMTLKPMELGVSAHSSGSSVHACIVPGCSTVYGCPLAYEALLLQIRFNLEEPSDAGCASFSLVSRIDSN